MGLKQKGIIVVPILLIIIGTLILAAPFHSSDVIISSTDSDITAIEDVELYGIFSFPSDTQSQIVNINLVSYDGDFSFILLTVSNLHNRTNRAPFSTLVEYHNVSSIMISLNLTHPINEALSYILYSTVGSLSVQGSITIQFDITMYSWSLLSYSIAVVSVMIIILWSRFRK